MSPVWVELGLSLAALPVVAAAGYLGLLALLARRASAPAPRTGRPPSLAVVVPAHDEEAGIGETVKSIRAAEYPRERFEVVVVADNCRDRTAEVARQAGARVLVREDSERRGKGYALRFAFDHVLGEGLAEAIIVVDADTVVAPNLLEAFAAHFAEGASALQAHYGVRNADDSWRTRLLAIAFEAFHGVRSRARERLGLSCGLRGNGMAFATEVLRAVPHEAFSIVEDLEYGIQLGYAGHRVHYVEEARVFGLMAGTETASRSQRRRWEGGRLSMARAHAFTLLKRAWAERNPILLDLALDILVPPLSTIALACLIGLAVTAAANGWGGPVRVALCLWAVSAAALTVYVLKGWALSGLGRRGLLDLLMAPAYVAWKVVLWRRRPPHRHDEWVRTERRSERR